MIVKYYTNYTKGYSIGDIVKLHKSVKMMRAIIGEDEMNIKHFVFMGIIVKMKNELNDLPDSIHIKLLEDIKDKTLIQCLNTPFWIDCLKKINET